MDGTEPSHVYQRDSVIAEMLIANVVDYAIYMIDLAGYVQSWNVGAERIKGYRAAEIVGSHFSRFFTPEDLAANEPARALASALSAGKFEAEGWRVRKDGTRFWANVVIDGVRDAGGDLVGFAKITRDVTESAARAREREQSIARVNAATRAARVGIWDLDIGTGNIVWDKMMFALHGFGDAAFTPTLEQFHALIHDQDAAEAEAAMARSIESGEPFEIDYRVIWPNGEVRNVHATGSVIRDEKGAARQVIGTVWDVTDVRVLGEQLRLERDRLAKTVDMWIAAKDAADEAQRAATLAAARDPLTGLLNRRGFEAWIEARTPGMEATLLYLDIDGFKAVNDAGGHAAGDATLKNVGRSIQRATRSKDCCARMGGDEFALILEGPVSSEGVRDVIERISDAVERLRPLGDSSDVRIGVSIGVARHDGKSSFPHALRQADADLYVQKRRRQAG